MFKSKQTVVENSRRTRLLQRAMPLLFAVLIGAIGTYVLAQSRAASTCTVSPILVNSCHPLLGSYATGYNLDGSGYDNTPSVAQTQAAEDRVGSNFLFNVIHTGYHRGAAGDTLTPEEIHYATTTNQTVFLNWWPTKSWTQGDTSAIYPEIDAMANSILAAEKIAPFKIMMTLQHEMNDKVTALDDPNDSTCATNVNLPGIANGYPEGNTPAAYRAMVVNVEKRFQYDGVNNIVWAILFESFNQDNVTAFPNCLDQALYPGNNYIDWVGYDTYGNGSTSPSANSNGTPSGQGAFQETAGKTYNFLESLSNNSELTTYKMMDKPVVLGEFNSCLYTPQQAADYFNDAKYTLDHHLYPQIQLYNVFDAPGEGVTPPGGCMLEYINGSPLTLVAQNAFNSFANDPIFTAGATTPTPTSVSFTSPANDSTVSGVVNLAATATAGTGLTIQNVIFKLTNGGVTTSLKTDTSSPYSDSWNSATVANGNYTLTAIATDSGGNTTQSTVNITVDNKITTTISAPTDITSPSQTSNSITLQWDASQDSSYPASSLTYSISRNGQQVGTTSAGATTYTDTGLNPDTTYSYTITASDSASTTSAASAAFTQTTKSLDCPAPAAPGGFTGSASSATSVDLSWGAVSPPNSSCTISHYVLERDGVTISQPTGLNFTDTGVSASTTYTYTVLAVTVDNTAGASSTTQVKTPASQQPDPGPTAPSNLTATVVNDNQINLTWTASTDSVTGIKQYNVLRNGTQVGTVTPTTSNTLSFGDSGLSAHTTYSYQVVAVSGGGKTTSSTTVPATTTDSMPPAIPKNLASSAQTTTSITLTWDASTDPVYSASSLTYSVYRGSQLLTTTPAGTTTYTDTGLSPGTTYSYTVTASNPSGDTSNASAAFTQATKNLNCAAPAAPSSFTATATATTSVSLSWKAVAATGSCTIAHYVLERDGITLSQLTGLSFTDTGVSASTTYTYTVLAVAVDNTPGNTSTAQATTPPAQQPDPGPTAPANLVATALNGTQINLTWTASTDSVTGIKQYNVLRNGTQVGTVTPNGNSLSFGDSGLSSSTTYSYQVVAVSGGGKTTGSASVQATTLDSTSPVIPPSNNGGSGSSNGTGNTNTSASIPILKGTTSVGSGSESGPSTSDNPSSTLAPSDNPGAHNPASTSTSKQSNPAKKKTISAVRRVAYIGSSLLGVVAVVGIGFWLVLWQRRQRYVPPGDPDRLSSSVINPGVDISNTSSDAVSNTPALESDHKKQANKENKS